MTDRSKKEGFQRWKSETRDPLTAKRPERKEAFETTYGNEIPPLAGPWQETSGDYDESLGYPGEYPFTRGVQPTMYRGRLWTMRQYAGFGTAAESNERYRYLLDQGTTGLSVAFDLPTQMGIDSDDVRAAGEVGAGAAAAGAREAPAAAALQLPVLPERRPRWPDLGAAGGDARAVAAATGRRRAGRGLRPRRAATAGRRPRRPRPE